MKNQISEDIKRSICKRNNYETAKKLLDDYYYYQCGHIDSISRDRDLERLFPIIVRMCFDIYIISSHKKILCTVPRSSYVLRHERYHDMYEVLEELGVKLT